MISYGIAFEAFQDLFRLNQFSKGHRDYPADMPLPKPSRAFDGSIVLVAVSNDVSSIASDEVERIRVQCYQIATASDDQLFHYKLYDWFITNQLAHLLLEVC